MNVKALPRLTDVNGELTLRVWDGEVDHTFSVTVGQIANLGQDIMDAMARRCRTMDGKGPVR